MIMTVKEVFYFFDRIANMKFFKEKYPGFAEEIQKMKDSCKETGESFEDYCDDEIEISIKDICDEIEYVLNKKKGV